MIRTSLASVCRSVTLDEIGLRSDRIGLSSATNLNSVLAVIRIVYVCVGLAVRPSILPFSLQRHFVPTASVMVWSAINHIRHMDTSNIDLRHYDSSAVRSWNLAITFLPFMSGLRRAIFHQNNCQPHTIYLPFEHQDGKPISLVELEVLLHQL